MGSEHIREWNEQVRRLADSLSDSAESRFGFSCQCGCGMLVPLTSRNFDANGAWADGHKPGTASDLEAASAAPDEAGVCDGPSTPRRPPATSSTITLSSSQDQP
jgi:hypothetical protein